MNKELFIETMNYIQSLQEKQLKVYDCLSELEEDGGAPFIYSGVIDYIVYLLKEIMNDESEWISYYLWEIDSGKDYKPGCVTEVDGRNIRLKTAEDLYSLITDDPIYEEE